MAGETEVKGAGATELSIGAGAEQKTGAEGAIPKGLERFAGQDGKIDFNKLGESYLTLEQDYHKRNQEHTTLTRAYQVLANKVGAVPPANPEEVRGKEIESFTADPQGYVAGAAKKVVSEEAASLGGILISLAHPELNDPKFKAGLDEFCNTQLPPSMNLSDFRTADWAIKLYKEHAAGGPVKSGSPALPHSESPSGAVKQPAGKQWSRTEIKKLQWENPAEYARQADEISAAYNEGRVKNE